MSKIRLKQNRTTKTGVCSFNNLARNGGLSRAWSVMIWHFAFNNPISLAHFVYIQMQIYSESSWNRMTVCKWANFYWDKPLVSSFSVHGISLSKGVLAKTQVLDLCMSCLNTVDFDVFATSGRSGWCCSLTKLSCWEIPKGNIGQLHLCCKSSPSEGTIRSPTPIQYWCDTSLYYS